MGLQVEYVVVSQSYKESSLYIQKPYKITNENFGLICLNNLAAIHFGELLSYFLRVLFASLIVSFNFFLFQFSNIVLVKLVLVFKHSWILLIVSGS